MWPSMLRWKFIRWPESTFDERCIQTGKEVIQVRPDQLDFNEKNTYGFRFMVYPDMFICENHSLSKFHGKCVTAVGMRLQSNLDVAPSYL